MSAPDPPACNIPNTSSSSSSCSSTPLPSHSCSPSSAPRLALLHFIKTLSSTNSSPAGIEKGLSLLGYTCKLVATLIRCRTPAASTLQSSDALAKGLDDLYTQTDCARYAIRIITGPFSTLDACLTDSWSYPPLPLDNLEHALQQGKSRFENGCDGDEYPYTKESHPFVRTLERAMPFAMAMYYPFEYLAFAGWFMPGMLYDSTSIPDDKTKQCSTPTAGWLTSPSTLTSFIRNSSNWRTPEEFSAVSCCAWLCYVVLDIVVQTERCYRISAILKTLNDRSCSSDNIIILDLEAQLRTSKVNLVREILCLLPAFAWSWPDFGKNPKVPKTAIRTLMWIESLLAYSVAVDDNNHYCRVNSK